MKVSLNALVFEARLTEPIDRLALVLANMKNGKVKCHYVTRPLDDLPAIYEEMASGQLAGRTVLKLF